MSDYKYKILWLDDDFEPVSSKTNIDENMTRKAFQEDVELASDFNLEVVGVSTFEKFCAEVKNLQSFQAVVFDLKGMEQNNETSDMVMPEALDILERANDIPAFVYSANDKSEKFEITLRNIKKEGRCFPKALGVNPLFEKIVEVLDANLHYYKGHEECLLVFTKGYLDATSNKAKMDELLSKYDKRDRTYAPYNNMRCILENVLTTLSCVGLIKEPSDKFSKRIAYLAEKVNPYKDKDGKIIYGEFNKPMLNYDDPVVSFNNCRREIKYIFKYLDDITNRYSHFLESSPNYLR
ncbi:MAG: hypothetical protein K6F78_09740, partial [Bacteroidaceae bacterium]|nr:hypothetical protein [Bacteroidaceae bacterium]